ncbi:Ig-like domain-containing protein [Aquabacter sp. CN5-332]|uniref:Ig-like domain-containing protein n=1 Tax=Aquabacter sp. CN5-332 TaxID=3156608 RepID=UPI0032B5F7D4
MPVLSVTALTANGVYAPGSNIEIVVRFDDGVNVTGTPRLLLETGVTDRYAVYDATATAAAIANGQINSGSCVFIYQVQPGDSSADLDYSGINALELNGGSITAGGNPVIIDLPASGSGGTLAETTDIVIQSPANTAPVAVSDTFAVQQGQTANIDVLANDVDAEGVTLTVTQIEGISVTVGSDVTIAAGTLTLTVGGIVFTPVAAFSGAVSFSYTVSDGIDSATTTVSGTVTPAVTPPTVVDDTFSMAQGGTFSLPVLANDVDSGGNPLTMVTEINGTSVSVGETVIIVNGSVTLGPSGIITITPDGTYTGALSFTYTATDGISSATATVSGSVMLGAATPPPTAANDTFTTASGTPVLLDVLANDMDPDGDLLSVVMVNGMAIAVGGTVTLASGTVTLEADGRLSFTPASGFAGAVSFTYTLSDGGLTDTATVSGTVTPAASPPTAADDSFTTTRGSAVLIDVLANDTDADGTPLSIIQVNGMDIGPGGTVALANGIVTRLADGRLTFAPAPDYTGPVSFTYTLSDGGLTDTGTVSGTVTAAPATPSAQADAFTTTEDSAITLDVLANDGTARADGWRIALVDGAAIAAGQSVTVAGGTVKLGADGNLAFSPDADFHGGAGFSYTIVNPAGIASTAHVSGTVTPVNDTPVARSDAFTLPDNGGPAVVDVLANDGDPEGDLLRITAIDGHAVISGSSVAVDGGTVMLGADGRLAFIHAEGHSGAATFSYTVADAAGAQASAIVTSSAFLSSVLPRLEDVLEEHGISVDGPAEILPVVPVVAPGVLDGTTVRDADALLGTLASIALGLSGTVPDMAASDAAGDWLSAAKQSLVFQVVSSEGHDVVLQFGGAETSFASGVSGDNAWSRAFALKALRPDFSVAAVTAQDGGGQGSIHQADMADGARLAVKIGGEDAGTPHAVISNTFGLIDFVSSDGDSAVEVSRLVTTAQTLGGAGDQDMLIRLRQNGLQDVQLMVYQVDDYSGAVDGLRPGDAGYDAASRAHAYQTDTGAAWISGAGYGAYGEARVTGVDSGDLFAMRLASGGHDFYMFGRANEQVDGEGVNHVWNYGLNTWGWEDLMGGGDRDFNDLLVQFDLVTPAL